MQNIDITKAWFQSLENQNKDTPHIVVGYGSLLSKQSRDRYSNIRSFPLPLTVRKWERSWVTRSLDEKQTYVGAYPNHHRSFNGQAFPTNIDNQLKKREQDYKFTQLKLEDLEFKSLLNERQFDKLSQLTFYICETLKLENPDEHFPVNMSYIDTCLKGCVESGGTEEAKRFVETTSNWPSLHRKNDRMRPNYPRAAQIIQEEWIMFDKLQAKEDW